MSSPTPWQATEALRVAPDEVLTEGQSEFLAERWLVFKTHSPAGAYLPVGQLDGDCRGCGAPWPCPEASAVLGELARGAAAQAWHERDRARPVYLGPDNGHYPDDCMGWGDCMCGTYPNPYLSPTPSPAAANDDGDDRG